MASKLTDEGRKFLQNSLDEKNYTTPSGEKYVGSSYELKTNDGKNIGTVSYGAYQAIQNNKLSTYKPKNDNEKRVLDIYKKYTGYGKTFDTVKSQYDKDKFGKGNIDLTNRPVLKNEDNTISTVDTITIGVDDKQVVIPTIVKDEKGNAKRLTSDEAVARFYQTGEHLGMFDTQEEADEYAQSLHIDQDLYYSVVPEITAEEQKVLDKYNINPRSFSQEDFEKWALEHGYEFNEFINGNGDNVYVPKYKNGKLVPSDQEQADFKVLTNIRGRENLQDAAKKYPITFSTATMLGAPVREIMSIGANIGSIGALATGNGATLESDAKKLVENTDLVRQTISEEHASKWFDGASGKLGNYGSLVYNGVMSIGDMVTTSLTMKGLGQKFGLTGKALNKFTANATSGLLASNGMQSTIIQKKKEGLSDGKAVAVGFATGLSEFITEKFSLEAIFKAPASTLKKGLISFIAEFSEEEASDILSKTADYFIAGDDSYIRKSIINYMNSGMSRKNATLKTIEDSAWETFSAGLVGGFSGVALSSVYHGYSKSEIKKTGADMRSVAADIIQSGLDSPEKSTAYKHAKKLQAKGIDNITDYEIGLQHTYNIEQIDYENEKVEKAAKKTGITDTSINVATSSKQANNDSTVDETVVTEQQTPVDNAEKVTTEQRNTFTEELDEFANTDMPTVSVGETFVESDTNKTIKIVGRDDNATTIEITTADGKTETKQLPNKTADTMAVDDKYSKVDSPTVSTKNAVASSSDKATQISATIDKSANNPKGYVNVQKVSDGRFMVTNAYGETVYKSADELNKRYIAAESNPFVQKLIDQVKESSSTLTAKQNNDTINTETNTGEVVGDEGNEAERLGIQRDVGRYIRTNRGAERLSEYFAVPIQGTPFRFYNEGEGTKRELELKNCNLSAKYLEITKENYTEEMIAIELDNKKHGIKTIYSVGEIEFASINGMRKLVIATIIDNVMFINANADANLFDIAKHEKIHYAIRKMVDITGAPNIDVAREFAKSLYYLMNKDEIQRIYEIMLSHVEKSYKNATKFNILDEFCAEIGYLICYPESADWFTDYDAAVKLFDDLLTLDPQKQTWLNKGIGTSNEDSSDAFSNEDEQTLSVGDTFLDKKTGGVLRVVSRNDANTVIERNTGGKIETKIFTNSQADALATNKEYERIEPSRAMAPETAQNYSVLVSNLKRKAEELGLLDNDFYTTLQNVDLFNPTIENIKLINSQFHEVFNGNDDTLVKSWLGGIDKILTDALTRQNGSSTINTTEHAEEGAIYEGQGNEENVGLWGHVRHGNNRRKNEKLSEYFGRTYEKNYSRHFGNQEGERKQLRVPDINYMAYFVEIPPKAYTIEMKSVAEKNKRYGVKTIFTIGESLFIRSAKSKKSVHGTVVGDIVFIDANLDEDLQDVANHELVHYAIRQLAKQMNRSETYIAQKVVINIKQAMLNSEYDRLLGLITNRVNEFYKNATEFNVLDEFCAEIGYLIRYHESAEWFTDYDAAVKLFDDLLTLDPKKQTWLNKGIGTSNEDSSDAFSNAEKQTLSVGDTFLDKKTGGVLRVVSRNDANTVIERNTGGKIETKIFTNSQADMIIANKQFEQIEKPMNTSSQEDVSSTAPSVSEDVESRIKMAENINEAHEDITNLTETVKKSLRPEMLSDERIMNMLKSRFGDKPFEALAKDIMLTFERDGSIGEREILFADGGQAVYDMLERGEADGAENFQMELNNQSENDIIEENNIDSINYSLESKKRNRKRNTSRKRTIYNEYQTNALMWARSTDRKAGDTTILNANGKYFALIEATEDDFIELCKGSYKEVQAYYERAYRKATDEVYGNTESLKAEQGRDIWDLQHAAYGRNDDRDGGQIGSEGLQDDSARSDEHLRGGDKGKYDSGIIEGNEKSDRGLSEEKTTISYLLESEEDYGERRNLLSDGSGKRKNGKSSQKQAQRVDGRTRRYKKGRKTANERRNYCKTQRASGHIRERIVYGHKCEVISEEAYNDDMHKMAERNSQNGIDETIFISGMAELPFTKDGIGNSKKAKGIFIKTKDGRKIVVVQYDNFYFTPEQINDHELVHNDYGSELTQKAKNIILNTLSQKEKEEMLGFIAEDYLGIINGDEAEVIEELVANILTGTHYKSDVFNELINAYWKKDDAFISCWEYETSKRSFKRQVEKGYYDNLNKTDGWLTPEREYAMLSKAIMAKNAGLTDEQLKPVDFVYAADGFYVYKNISMGNFELLQKWDTELDVEKINNVRKCIDNDTYADGERLNRVLDNVQGREGGNTRNNGSSENGRTTNGNVKVSSKQQRSDTVGYPSSAGGNNEVESKHSFKRQVEKENYGNLNKTDGRLTPEQEYAMISKAIMAKNAGLTDEQLNPVDFVYAADGFYVYKNISMGDFEILHNYDASKDRDEINLVEELIGNGFDTVRRAFDNGISSIKSGKTSNIRDFGRIENTGTKRKDAQFPDRQQRSDAVRYPSSTRGNNEVDVIKYSLAGENTEFWDVLLKEFTDKYGAIPKGEKPARNINVPNKISINRPVSRFARTMMEAGITPDFAISEFELRILDGTMTHEVITDKSAKNYAENKIKEDGYEEALRDWEAYSKDNKAGKKETALGMMLYNQAITNKDVKTAMKIAAELVANATRAGQTLQATRMLKMMSPDGQLYYLEKSIQKMNEEFKEKLGKKYKEIKMSEELMEKFLYARTEEAKNNAYDELCQNIADQIPATFRDKWDSWRYLAMLGNTRTHIRNILGNAAFVPAIRIKNYVGAVIEKTAGIKKEDRTKTFFKSKEAVEFAKKDYDVMEKVIKGVNAKYAVTEDIEGKRTIFKTRLLEKLRIKNFEFLEKEDAWFLKKHYVDALARVLTARQIDLKAVSEDVLDKARTIAVKEAQAATYRDANAVAEGLARLERHLENSNNKALRATGILVEGVMPFKKTPLNIAKQGLLYSPAGLLTTTYKGLKKLKNNEAYTAAEVIDELSKGLTGTGIILLGMFLASLGIATGGGDKNKKKRAFDKMTGEQNYALEIGGKSYTIDWMAPLSLPFFVGVELYNLTQEEGLGFAQVTQAVSGVAEPLLELSVFQGIDDLFETAQYSEAQAVFAIAEEMATSYLMQAMPTIGGQISRITDGTKRNYYFVDKNKDVPRSLQSLCGQISAKVPLLSLLFEPMVDNWGREEAYGGIMERIVENTLSPGYYSKEEYSKVDKELEKLYERTGEPSVLPTEQVKYYTVDGVTYNMTAELWTKVKQMRGKKSFEFVKALLADRKVYKTQKKPYSKMTDKEKVKAIERCYEEAGDYTKEKMLERVKKAAR